MPKLSGLFGTFDNLDLIPIESVAAWLKPTPNLIQLENYIANKILYPQTIPITEYEMKIDLSLLREALRLNRPTLDKKTNTLLGDNPFLNITLRKIIIPKKFLPFVPNLVNLTWAFIDGLLLGRKKEDWFQDLWTVVLTDDMVEVVGSVLLPQFENRDSFMDLNILSEQSVPSKENFKIRPGSLTVIPCPKDRCHMSYKFSKGTILGKQESVVEIYGGNLGLIVDGRSV